MMINLERLTKKELMEIAKKKNVTVNAKDLKATIIKKLKDVVTSPSSMVVQGNYNKMTKAQLIAIAAKKGIHVEGKELKRVIIEKIEQWNKWKPHKKTDAKEVPILTKAGIVNGTLLIKIMRDMVVEGNFDYDTVNIFSGIKKITISWNKKLEEFKIVNDNEGVVLYRAVSPSDDAVDWENIVYNMDDPKLFLNVVNNMDKLHMEGAKSGLKTKTIANWVEFVAKYGNYYPGAKTMLRSFDVAPNKIIPPLTDAGKVNATILLNLMRDMVLTDHFGYSDLYIMSGAAKVSIHWDWLKKEFKIVKRTDVPNILMLKFMNPTDADMNWMNIVKQMNNKPVFFDIINNLEKLHMKAGGTIGYRSKDVDDWPTFIKQHGPRYAPVLNQLRGERYASWR